MFIQRHSFLYYLHALFISTLLTSFSIVSEAQGQVLVNGQTFTYGLSIIDAPNPRSTYNAGGTLAIAVDVSGDGHLQWPKAAEPGSGLSTSYNSLDIFLVSSDTKINMTVSDGNQLLQQESGSTVKHVNFNMSTCLPAGSYNLTFYESSNVNSKSYYTISSIPINFLNPKQSGSCSNLNTLEAQPQSDSSLTQSPFAAELSGTPSAIWSGSVMPTSTAAAASSAVREIFAWSTLFMGITTAAASLYWV